MFPIASLAFVGGIVTGSFVGWWPHRLPRGRSIVGPRSVCDSCGAQIAAYDNVPVLSWLLLRGRCRSCRRPDPAPLPAGRARGGRRVRGDRGRVADDPAQLALGLLFVAMLAAITLTDLERRIIPNEILLAGAVAGLGRRRRDRPRKPPGAGDRRGRRRRTSCWRSRWPIPAGWAWATSSSAAVMGLYLGSSVAAGPARRRARRGVGRLSA